ncbi:hypothetical protein [Tautonia marina]|uniref:hypothetical protein n=1 Tax=Tautonia marina TaxID=2653855 RepID=UPI0012611019|nr:hypothetical protein [Tautonia marina]
MIKHQAVMVLLSLVVSTPMLGCGGGGGPKPPMGKVSGTVTHNGSPLTEGSVVFSPAQDKGSDTGHVAIGKIDTNGRFVLTTFNTGDGAVLGQHVVTIQAKTAPKTTPEPNPDGTITFEYSLGGGATIPAKYENPEQSPLRYTVEPGSNTFEIDLTD